jgi:hypothetical protein
MSQRTARHDRDTTSEDENVAELRGHQPEHKQTARPRQPQPPGPSATGGGVGTDEPDEGEFELIGDDDLSATDLGPAAPNATDPDAPSGRPREIDRGSRHVSGRRQA